MINHPSGPDNGDIPKPTAVELLAESPWVSDHDSDTHCRWCKCWQGSAHDDDCPWHRRMMDAKGSSEREMPTLLVNKTSEGTTIEELPKASQSGDVPPPRLWVIGTDSGLGSHIAAMAGPDGWEVIATTREQCDVRDGSDIRGIIKAHGPFDGVVYCAGVNHLAWSQDIEERHIWDTFDVNVAGFIRVVRSLAQIQRDRPTSLVAISSDAAHTPMRTSTAYCASKAALSMAVRCVAREHAPTWRVNAIQPAAIAGTEMSRYVDQTVPELRNWSPNEAADRELSSSPMGRRATMGEVAALTLSVLAGPEYLTGSLIDITGGK